MMHVQCANTPREVTASSSSLPTASCAPMRMRIECRCSLSAGGGGGGHVIPRYGGLARWRSTGMFGHQYGVRGIHVLGVGFLQSRHMRMVLGTSVAKRLAMSVLLMWPRDIALRLRSGIEALLSLLLPRLPVAFVSACAWFRTCPAFDVGLSCEVGVWMSNCCVESASVCSGPEWPGGGTNCVRLAPRPPLPCPFGAMMSTNWVGSSTMRWRPTPLASKLAVCAR